jgi:hypothetical protein
MTRLKPLAAEKAGCNSWRDPTNRERTCRRITVAARIADTSLDGSRATLLVDGRLDSDKWAWARGDRTDPLAFGSCTAFYAVRHFCDVSNSRYGVTVLQITEHPVRLAQEKKHEGKYLLQTDQTEITPSEAVQQYKQLSEVERAFRNLKDPLSLRPIRHRTNHRVRGHIFVAALAFLLNRLLERRLKATQTNLSTEDAWSALETIRHVTFRVQGEHRIGITPGSARARKVLEALGLTDLRPPAPATAGAATM